MPNAIRNNASISLHEMHYLSSLCDVFVSSALQTHKNVPLLPDCNMFDTQNETHVKHPFPPNDNFEHLPLPNVNVPVIPPLQAPNDNVNHLT